MSDKLAAGVRISPAEADSRVAAAQELIDAADRKRVAAQAELATLAATLAATKDALLASEARVIAMESEKRTVEARLRLVQDECTRLDAQLVSAQNMRSTADELINHIGSRYDAMQSEFRSVRASDSNAPTFELSFVRDSNGRIKSPVTAKPRA